MEKKIYIPKTIYAKDQYGCHIQLFAEGTEEDQHMYNIKVNAVTVENPQDLPEPVGQVTLTSFHAGPLETKVLPEDEVVVVQKVVDAPATEPEVVEETKEIKKNKGNK